MRELKLYLLLIFITKTLKMKMEPLNDKSFNPYTLSSIEDNVEVYSIDEDNDIKKLNFSSRNLYNSEKYTILRKNEMELQDKLWAFSYNNGWYDKLLSGRDKCCITYNITTRKLQATIRHTIVDNNVYFITKEIAEMAIEKFGDEIINILEERRSIVNDEATEKCKKFPKEYVYEL